MKKVLVFLSIAFVAQGLLAEPTQYKYLNRLEKGSQIREKCEQVNKAWLVRGETEKSCNLLDDFFNVYAQVCRDYPADLNISIFSSKDQVKKATAPFVSDLVKKAPSVEELDKATTILGVDTNHESVYISLLAYDIAAEEKGKDMNDSKRHFAKQVLLYNK